jgi:hypothetical protein
MVPLLFIRVSQAALLDKNPHFLINILNNFAECSNSKSVTDNVQLNPRYLQRVSPVEVHFEVNII